MGKPIIGEVIVIPFPQTDLQVGKRRPALVVADLTGDDLILCQITTQSRHDNYSVELTGGDSSAAVCTSIASSDQTVSSR